MWLFCLSLLPYFLFTAYKTRKSFHMLQQNFYDEANRYFLWILKSQKKIWLDIDAFFPILIVLSLVSYKFGCIIFALFYVVLIIQYHNRFKTEQTKKPLVGTARIKRLSVTMIVIYLIAILPMFLLQDAKMVSMNYLYLAFLTYLNYLVVSVANAFNKPIERCVYLSYRNKAIKKLKTLEIPVIGITGSYGKTSSKNVIDEILNIKFNAYASPKNYNTDYGIILTVNNYLDKFNDYFIAEMGAFKRGDIAKICEIARPKYGILTIIGEAHLDTFGSKENIRQGKFELIESLPEDGLAILNGDDEYQRNYHLRNDCSVCWIGIDNKDVDLYATNIQLSHLGTSFDVKFKDDEKFYPFQTKLLGNHNIYNLLVGILLGKKLGMAIEEIERGIARIKPVEHRLSMSKLGNLNIIDDAYNSNPIGSKMAVEILGLMPGTKIIVTPGMIELGERQYSLNQKFGTYIAQHVDYAILIGKEQTKPIYDGLMESKFPEDKIFVLNDVREAFPLMKKLGDDETYVLLENDLPDIFNE